MKKILLFAMLFSTLFAACKDPEKNPDQETTVEQDKANIRASFDRVKNLVQNFRNGNFYHFAEDFLGAGPQENVDYIWVGEGNGNYAYGYINTPGTGTYTRYACDYGENGYCYTYVGEGNGDYSWGINDVGQGNGAYKQGDPYTSYDMILPEFTELLGEKFGNIMESNFDELEQGKRFKMQTFAGKYTWNKTTKEWDKTTKNDIQVVFPSTENGEENCELAITEYTDKECDIEGEKIWFPTKVSSYFKKDGEKIAGVDAAGDFNAYGIPKNASVSVYAKPITLKTSLQQVGTSNFSAIVSVDDETDAKNSLSIVGDAALSKDINNYTDVSDCEINHLIFTLTQYELAIKSSVDIKTLNGIENPSISDINAHINFEVFYKNAKTGTLRVEEVGEDQYLFIVYKDGTKENTNIYYDSFLTDIENMFLKK